MSISTKTLATLLFVLLTVFLVSGWISAQNERTLLTRLLEKQGQSLSNSISSLSIEALLSEDYPVLDTFLQTLGRKMENVLSIEIIHNGKVVSKYSTTSAGEKPVVFNSDILLSAAVGDKPEKIGVVRLSLSNKDNELIISQRVRELIFNTLLILVVLALLQITLLKKIVIDPIKKLVVGIKRVSTGDLSYSVDIRSRDEFGSLATTFNTMAENLRQTTVSKIYVDNILKSMTDMLIVITPEGKILTVNQSLSNRLSYKEEDLIGRDLRTLFDEDDELVLSEEMLRDEAGVFRSVEKCHVTKNGEKIPVLFSSSVMRDKDIVRIVCVTHDITERKKAEEEREQLIHELKDALAKVKTLSGLIPICSSCQKIRDDKGYWNQVDDYISKHSEAEFSHGYCPECAENFKETYSEFFKENDN